MARREGRADPLFCQSYRDQHVAIVILRWTGCDRNVALVTGNSDRKFRVTVTASVPGESKRDVEPRCATRSFPRNARLLRHADFERVYKLGRRHFSASMTVFYRQRQEPGKQLRPLRLL